MRMQPLAKTRRGDKVMRTLLRAPKTYHGLLAAALAEDFSAHYVRSWLAYRLRSGEVLRLQGDGIEDGVYLMSERERHIPPPQSDYPAWMAPAVQIPTYTTRTVYRCGQAAQGDQDD